MYSKSSACPDVATNILLVYQMYTTNYLHLLRQNGHFTLQKMIFVETIWMSPHKRLFKLQLFCLFRKEVFRELPVQKTGKTGPD